MFCRFRLHGGFGLSGRSGLSGRHGLSGSYGLSGSLDLPGSLALLRSFNLRNGNRGCRHQQGAYAQATRELMKCHRCLHPSSVFRRGSDSLTFASRHHKSNNNRFGPDRFIPEEFQ